MDEAINSSKEDSYRLKTDFSLTDAEDGLIQLNKKIKLYKTRRFQMILIGTVIAILGILFLITPSYFNTGFYWLPKTIIVVVAIISMPSRILCNGVE